MKENTTQKKSMINIILLSLIFISIASPITIATSDTQDVTITMNQPKMCIPGAEEARGQSIYKCNPTGTGWELNITCETCSVPGLNEAGTNLVCVEFEPVVPSSISFINPFIVVSIIIILSITMKKSKGEQK